MVCSSLWKLEEDRKNASQMDSEKKIELSKREDEVNKELQPLKGNKYSPQMLKTMEFEQLYSRSTPKAMTVDCELFEAFKKINSNTESYMMEVFTTMVSAEDSKNREVELISVNPIGGDGNFKRSSNDDIIDDIIEDDEYNDGRDKHDEECFDDVEDDVTRRKYLTKTVTKTKPVTTTKVRHKTRVVAIPTTVFKGTRIMTKLKEVTDYIENTETKTIGIWKGTKTLHVYTPVTVTNVIHFIETTTEIYRTTDTKLRHLTTTTEYEPRTKVKWKTTSLACEEVLRGATTVTRTETSYPASQTIIQPIPIEKEWERETRPSGMPDNVGGVMNGQPMASSNKSEGAFSRAQIQPLSERFSSGSCNRVHLERIPILLALIITISSVYYTFMADDGKEELSAVRENEADQENSCVYEDSYCIIGSEESDCEPSLHKRLPH